MTNDTTSGNNEMMVVHQNHPIQVMMTTTEDHIDHPKGDVGSVNTSVKIEGLNTTAQDLHGCIEVPHVKGPIALRVPGVTVRTWMMMTSMKVTMKQKFCVIIDG